MTLPFTLPSAPARPRLPRIRRTLPLILCGWLFAGATGAPLDRTSETLREHVDQLRARARVVVDGEEVVSHVALPLLYDDAAFQPLWRDPARVEALLASLAGLADDGLRPDDYHLRTLAAEWSRVRSGGTPEQVAAFDLLATDAFVVALYHLYLGKVDPLSIEATWNFDPREVRDREALDFLRKAIASGRIAGALDDVRPKSRLYEAGRRALAEYRAIAAHGGWGRVPDGPKLVPGTDDPRVPALRQRLAATGDYAPGADAAPAGTTYDPALVAAVRTFQARHQMSPDGVVGAGTLRELNVPVAARIDQLRLNLERGRWVLHEIDDRDLVVVDIAGFNVRFIHEGRTVWQSRVIVGQPFRQTPIFRANIEYVVFNPTWTVPPGILDKDVLPAMRRGDDILKRKGLKVYDRQNREVDPHSVAWAKYNGRNFPYFLRQASGDDNALGRVKIMFPNPHLVYLHDTPTRSLFDRDERTFSSGCIRVQKALALAERVLADPERWNAQAIDAVVATGQTRTVTLARKLPVLLIYWTADRDDAGRIVFKRDVYRRDPPLLRALDAPFAFGKRPHA
jgi:murein L,D-transpeptidase YcbB/YkuD